MTETNVLTPFGKMLICLGFTGLTTFGAAESYIAAQEKHAEEQRPVQAPQEAIVDRNKDQFASDIAFLGAVLTVGALAGFMGTQNRSIKYSR